VRILNLKKRETDYRLFIRRRAAEEDCSTSVTEPCKVFDQHGNLQLIYDQLEAETGPLVESLRRIKYAESTRTGGLVTRSRIFGYMPRLERRQRAFCNVTSLAREHPTENAHVCQVARAISERYSLMAPERYRDHSSIVGEKVSPEWTISGSVFTSGIINKNNALSYHFDSGNFEDVFSCMLVLRQNMMGGWLCFPELDAKFLFGNKAIAMFDGQRLLHGVTPMTARDDNSYRFSIVYYSLKGMWKCLTMSEELANARRREMARLDA
jgi:hypothetical protein